MIELAPPNLGKLFTSCTKRPATAEDIKILSPGDWISEKDCPWSWQFKNSCQDMAVGVWEGKEFFIPTNLLMVCTVVETNPVEKFLESDCKFKVGDRVRDTFGDRLKGRLERKGIVLELCKKWAIVRWDCQPESHVGGCQWSYEYLEIEKSFKPVLSPGAPIAVTLFAGGGGVEAGMVEAGIRPLIAVEFDPKKPKLSGAITDTHERNFGEYGCQVERKTVQEISKLRFPFVPHTIDFLHASPMCSNFSVAKDGVIETQDDIDMATAVAEIIRYLKPKFFTLENVKRYRDSQSFKVIAQALEEEGYLWQGQIMTLLDCQARERFIVRAAKGWLPPLPEPIQPVGWYEMVSGLIPKMTDSELVSGQKKALEEFLSTNEPTPLLIQRIGARKREYRVKPAHLPCSTILRSHFTDGKGNNRNKFADIWLPFSFGDASANDTAQGEPGGTVKSLSLEAAARLQGFPDWYEFPPDTATAGSIIGYSVPPKFAARLFKSLQQPPPTEIQIQMCQERIIQHNWHIQNLDVLPQTKDIKEAIKKAKGAIASEQDRINQLLEDLIICRQFIALGWDRSQARNETLKLLQRG
ncbi:MAG: DNA cytosine methyltransferase [Nostoc sp. NMS7]|uniref:DNA cytosine methyltransferase n=1 Tax=Nostoc sp. NMS7 TaxID=2815391 RepID=UPI0025EE32D7|nr:DNA cytosine methyltransferase [Nostoc sp. NMS7]MBN3951921.1 DNA cytosine methyltransferase [Nostoc sp. NMS7]